MPLWLLGSLAIALLVGLYFVYRYDWRQIQGRSRRHADAGGARGEAPDVIPPHGGGGGIM